MQANSSGRPKTCPLKSRKFSSGSIESQRGFQPLLQENFDRKQSNHDPNGSPTIHRIRVCSSKALGRLLRFLVSWAKFQLIGVFVRNGLTIFRHDISTLFMRHVAELLGGFPFEGGNDAIDEL
jgi:hypothetical protein